jgi:hypothetical protein
MKAVFSDEKQSKNAATPLMPWQYPILSNLAANAYNTFLMLFLDTLSSIYCFTV